MAIQKIFAYNTGSLISGTTQVGDIAISEANVEYSANFGGLQWWGGPDETYGYVIAHTDPSGSHDGGAGGSAYLGFWRSSGLTDSDFLTLCNSIPPRIGDTPFTNTTDASAWLYTNGYWTSFYSVTPTPTASPVLTTPTPTPSVTPTMYYYSVSGYSCGVSCSLVGSYTVMSPTPLTIGYFYNNPENRGYTFEILSLIPQVGGAYDLTGEPGFAVCIDACNQPSPSPTPTLTQTPTSTDLTNITTYTISGCTSLNEFVANLGPGALAPGDIFYFEFTGGTPSGCYRIVNKINAVPTDGTTPLYFYTSCTLCVAAREVTPTPTVTNTQTPTPSTTSTPTPSVTNTQTPSVTPTLTPTPSSTQTPVTGYSFNLVVLPYEYPTSGNTIMVDQAASGSGTTNPNVFATNNNGIYFNAIDTNGVNRTNYFAAFTGQSITLTISQTGSTAIYSGDSKAFQSWTSSGQTGFTFGYGIAQPGYSAGTTTLIQSAPTNWVTGQTVYISAVVNGVGVTPTPTATSVTPTPTPTSGSTGVGWFFYSPDNQPVLAAPANNGNTTFINTGGGNGTYNPNYTGGTLNLYFNNNNSAGTSYASQFSTLDTAGGTITISQGSSTAIYSGTSTDYQSSGTFIFLNVNRSAQMIQSASTPFVSGTSINVVVS